MVRRILLTYCDMVVKNRKLQNLRIMEMSQRHPLLGNVFLKPVSTATYMCPTDM
jgi:hypothetical protein